MSTCTSSTRSSIKQHHKTHHQSTTIKSSSVIETGSDPVAVASEASEYYRFHLQPQHPYDPRHSDVNCCMTAPLVSSLFFILRFESKTLSRLQFYDTFTPFFSELACYLFLRFRVQPYLLPYRGRVQWWNKFAGEFFFRAGKVLFERNRKSPLYSFMDPE